jgi:hypothetical protein
MPYLNCLACNTRLYNTESQADPIGDLCPDCGSLLEPVGDLGEIVRYRVIETRGSTSPHGASRAGRLIAGRVREIIARGELKHAPIRPESKAATLTLSAQQSKPLALALRARAKTLPRSHHIRALATPARAYSFRCGASSALTAPPHESSLRLGRQATHRHEPS